MPSQSPRRSLRVPSRVGLESRASRSRNSTARTNAARSARNDRTAARSCGPGLMVTMRKIAARVSGADTGCGTATASVSEVVRAISSPRPATAITAAMPSQSPWRSLRVLSRVGAGNLDGLADQSVRASGFATRCRRACTTCRQSAEPQQLRRRERPIRCAPSLRLACVMWASASEERSRSTMSRSI